MVGRCGWHGLNLKKNSFKKQRQYKNIFSLYKGQSTEVYRIKHKNRFLFVIIFILSLFLSYSKWKYVSAESFYFVFVTTFLPCCSLSWLANVKLFLFRVVSQLIIFYFSLRIACNTVFSLTGCGTGKYLKVNSQVHTLGCDYCGPLVEIARSRGCEVMVCDNLNLPFRDQGFDAIISIGGKAAWSHVHSLP